MQFRCYTYSMYNINHDHNKELMDNCKSLQEYALYIKIVRENIENGMMAAEAVECAVDRAVKMNLLNGFFARHRAEVVEKLLTDYDKDVYETGLKEEGREEGQNEKAVSIAATLLKRKMSDQDIIEITGITADQLKELKFQIKED